MDFFWEKDNWEQEDHHLSGLRSAPFQRKFPFIPEKPGIFFIRGPRQIGKSSWLKTILSSKAKENSCFYLSCENVRDHLDLAEILRSQRGKRFILLDEISFVKEWARAIKYEADTGNLNTLVLTGSHAADLRRGMDLMPGRWGNGGEFLLLPMDFDEFHAVRKQAGWNSVDRKTELEIFFRIGGFPTAVAEAGPTGIKPVQAMDTYLKWLKGDLIRLGKQEVYLRELLAQLAITMSSPISLQKLAQKTQIASHHTVQAYIENLEDCFAMRTLYAIDENTGAYRFRKDKKFYFIDPLIYWIALDWAGYSEEKSRSFEQIAELVANEALVKNHKRIGYLHSPQGEIDFFIRNQWALEVKWSPVVQNLSKKFKDLKIPRKIVWNQDTFLKEWP
jgi:predicted AAA+ superfamily ATPase